MRMGAKSATIVYRRDNSKMPARQIELGEAISDGVKVIYNTRVVSAEIEHNNIKRIKCVKTDSTTEKVTDIANSEFYLDADSIIFAIGLKPDRELILKEGIKLNEKGLIETSEKGITNIKGVFAGGDVCQNKATVCRAIESGKKASEEIDKYIKKLQEKT